MLDILWTEPFSTVAFWGYIALCVVSVWFWTLRGLFSNKKRWFLLASVLGGGLYLLLSLVLGRTLYPATLFPCTAVGLFIVGKWRKIHFSRAEYLVGSVLSLLVDALLALLLLTPYFDGIGLK